MITTRADIVARAREMLGTPYHHQGRLVGVGLDCVGPVVIIGQEMGITGGTLMTPNYSKWADGVALKAELGRYMEEIDPNDAVPGDVLVFWVVSPEFPQHVAIKTDQGMIHSNARCGRTVEQGISDNWKRRLCAAFRYPGVT